MFKGMINVLIKETTDAVVFSQKELFDNLVTHSFPVCIMCIVIPSHGILSFFSAELWGKKVGCFFNPENLPFLE